MGTNAGPARPPERFGPFVLERRLGTGAAGEVHLARPSVGTRPAPVFVIKRPLAGGDPTRDFEALSHEAALNQAVVHPNVVRVFGAGMVGDRPYLALEYVEGVDAHRLVRALAAAGA
ncbi:MAG: protein kinase, partial [Deltaproteobacteria bacterium]|nr:protein kinase [Deltaproteobacteria bacterium]